MKTRAPLLKATPQKFAMVVRLLMEDSYSVQDLHELTGLCHQTVRHIINALRDDSNGFAMAYISGWDIDYRHRYNIRHYSFGLHPDMEKPAPRTNGGRRKLEYAKRESMDLMHRLAGPIKPMRRPQQTYAGVPYAT
jgi:hypothetical protein